MTIWGFLVAYVFGVVTTLALLAYGFWILAVPTSMTSNERKQLDNDNDCKKSMERGEPIGYRDLKAGEFFENCEIGLKSTYSGWLTVTSEFYRFAQLSTNDASSKIDNEDTNISGVSSLFKSKKGKSKDEPEDPATKSVNQLSRIRKKYRFYGVLKHGNLFLYTDQTKTNTKAVIVLNHFLVSMWPRNLKESQLFTKRSAICLINTEGLNSLDIESLLLNSDENTVTPNGSYFLYGDTHSEKEDIYLALLRASKKPDSSPTGSLDDLFDPTFIAKSLHYKTADINDLIQTLNSTEGQLTTKWINALFGRIFLAIYHTPEFENWCVNYIETKLRKMRIPGFLDNLQIKRIEVGHSAPFLTNPRLERLSPEGDLDVVFNILYQGGCVIEISTKLFLSITGFKQREFDVILKITVKKVKGDFLVRVKKQPSNRIWYAFTEAPELDLDIEPVFSSRALNYSIVTNMIQTKIREALNQSLVLPFLDNVAFYDAADELFRAGIWDKKFRSSLGDLQQSSENDRPPPLPSREPQSAKVEKEKEKKKEDDDLATKSLNSTTTGFSNKNESLTHRSSVSSSVTKTTSTSVGGSSELKDTPNSIASVTESQETVDSDTSIPTTSITQEKKIKQKVANSYSMLKQWYNKKVPAATQIDTEPSNAESLPVESKNVIYGASHPPTVDPNSVLAWNGRKHTRNTSDSSKKGVNYTPPEMISNRRPRQSHASTASSNLNASIDVTHTDDRQSLTMDDTTSIIPLSPASPQMFVNDKFKAENAEALNSPMRKRNSSGSFNIYTATAEFEGTSDLGHHEFINTVRRGSLSGENPFIMDSAVHLQQVVGMKASRPELEKIPTTIHESQEHEPSSTVSKRSNLKRGPPPPLLVQHSAPLKSSEESGKSS